MTTREKATDLVKQTIAVCLQLMANNPQATDEDKARLAQDTQAWQAATDLLGIVGPLEGNTYDPAGNLVWVDPVGAAT